MAAISVALASCGGDAPVAPVRAPPPPPRAPNVVVVMTDDQDVASLEVMPRVRRLLGARGVTFSRSFATTPECCPSRASFLTGQYAHNHDVLSGQPPDGGYPALDGSNTLPLWLQAAGYRTAWFGKYLNGYGSPIMGLDPHEIPPGWDTWAAFVNHSEYRMYRYELNRDGTLRSYGRRPRDYQTDVLARISRRYVRDAAERRRPFFAVVAPLAPHVEIALDGRRHVARNPRPAPRDRGAYRRRALPAKPAIGESIADKPGSVRARARRLREQAAAGARSPSALYRGRLESLQAVDDLVAGVVATLRRVRTLDETYVVFTSDNGFLLGEHGLYGKVLPYEESARVPLVIRGPGLPAGVERRQLVANIDLAPTIAELAGATPGLEVDGVSLLRRARDARAGRLRSLVIEYLSGERPYTAIRTSSDLLLARYAGGEGELYDLRSDPAELHNRYEDPRYAAIRLRLAQRLQALRRCAGSTCR